MATRHCHHRLVGRWVYMSYCHFAWVCLPPCRWAVSLQASSSHTRQHRAVFVLRDICASRSRSRKHSFAGRRRWRAASKDLKCRGCDTAERVQGVVMKAATAEASVGSAARSCGGITAVGAAGTRCQVWQETGSGRARQVTRRRSETCSYSDSIQGFPSSRETREVIWTDWPRRAALRQSSATVVKEGVAEES